MDSAVLLIDPKYGENVGGAIRACAAFDVPILSWTGSRVPLSKKVKRYGRLFENAGASSVDYGSDAAAFAKLCQRGLQPVAIELCSDSISLAEFEHPQNAVYVFGPEDGTLSKKVRSACQSRVCIPTERCLNLAAAVNVVLYDRAVKLSVAQAAASG